jgi:hypothetical protein
MQRHNDWPLRLHQKLIELKDKSFESGHHDCILAAATLIESMTGTDPGADFRGKYSSELGATKQIKKAGFDSLESLVDDMAAKHGMTPVSPNFHHRGDLVMLDDGVFGIVHLDGLHAVYVTTEGLAKKPLSEVKRIWRTPY